MLLVPIQSTSMLLMSTHNRFSWRNKAVYIFYGSNIKGDGGGGAGGVVGGGSTSYKTVKKTISFEKWGPFK